jgi:hypothetical protein
MSDRAPDGVTVHGTEVEGVPLICITLTTAGGRVDFLELARAAVCLREIADAIIHRLAADS